MKTIKKKPISLCLVLVATLGLASCADKSSDSVIPNPTPSPSHMVINSDKKVTEIMGAHPMVVNVSSNVDFKYAANDGADWITPESAEKTHAKGDSVKIAFNLTENQSGGDRQAVLLFAPADSKDFTDTVYVTQTGVIRVKTPGTLWQEIRNSGVKDSLAIKKMTVEGTLGGADVLCLREMAGVDVNNKGTKGQLTELTFSNVFFQKDNTVYFIDPFGQHKAYHIDTDKDVLPRFMFAACPTLRKFTISSPHTITTIGAYAFMLSAITDVNLPEGVTDIKDGAFNTAKLQNIKLPNGLINIGSAAFSSTGLTDIKLPNSLEKIGNSIFSFTSLKTITIPERIKYIPDSAFMLCMKLENIEFAKDLTTIGKNAFQNCSLLKSITIPDGITAINKNTFEDCTSLTSINIPANVSVIDDSAFKGCGKTLISVIIQVSDPTHMTLGDWSFDTSVQGTKSFLYVPQKCKGNYTKDGSPFLKYFDADHVQEQQ